MKIKITEKNRAKIEAALAAVNGKARAHTIDDYDQVQDIALATEVKLFGVAQKERIGTEVLYTKSGPHAAAYKFNTISTRIALYRGSTGWFLTGVKRDEVRPKQAERWVVKITRETEAALVKAALAPFSCPTARDACIGDLVEVENRFQGSCTSVALPRHEALLKAVYS